MAFTTENDAERARQLLLRNGFADRDVVHYNRREVIAEFKESEEHAVSPIQIGQEMEKVDKYLAMAKEGSGFLALRASKDADAKRAVDLVRPLGLRFAEKYNKLTIEQLA
jgi:hypothetical protein